jgi:hypothetical protein
MFAKLVYLTQEANELQDKLQELILENDLANTPYVVSLFDIILLFVTKKH